MEKEHEALIELVKPCLSAITSIAMNLYLGVTTVYYAMSAS
jgi:hypothetical protein